MLRLGQPIAAPRPIGGDRGTLQSLLPDPLRLGPLGGHLLGRPQGDLDCGRSQGRQDLLGDQRVDTGAGQGLAALSGAVVGQLPSAHILRDRGLGADVVANGHAPAAAAAARQPRQQRRSRAHHPWGLGAGGVGGQPGQVGVILLDGDVGRQHPGDRHQPSSSARTTRPVLGRPGTCRRGSTRRRP
jgi:hypothetical protein